MYFEAQQTNDERELKDTEEKDAKDLLTMNKSTTHQIFKSQEIRTSTKVITKSWSKSSGEKSEISDYRNSNYIINRRSRQGIMEANKIIKNEAEIQTDERYLKVLKGIHCFFYIIEFKMKESLKECFLSMCKTNSMNQIYHALLLIAVKLKLLLNRSFMGWKMQWIAEKTRNLQKSTLSLENLNINQICINKLFLEKSENETQTSTSFINIIKWLNAMVHILEFNKKISLIVGFSKISQFNLKSLKLRAIRIIVRFPMHALKQAFCNWSLFSIRGSEKERKISNLQIESLSELTNNFYRAAEIEREDIEIQTDMNYFDSIRSIQCLFCIFDYKRKLILKDSFCSIENASDFSSFRKSLRRLNSKLKTVLSHAFLKWKVKCDCKFYVNMKIDILNREQVERELICKGFLILFKFEYKYKIFAFSTIRRGCLIKKHDSEVECVSNQFKLHKVDSAASQIYRLMKKISYINTQTCFRIWKDCISALKILSLDLELSCERAKKACLFFLYIQSKLKKQYMWKYFYKLKLNAIKFSQQVCLNKLVEKEKLISATKIAKLLYLLHFKSNQKIFYNLKIFNLQKAYWIAKRKSKAKFLFSLCKQKWLIKMQASLLLWKINWKTHQLYSIRDLLNDIKSKKIELNQSITNERKELDELDKKIIFQQEIIKGLLNERDEVDQFSESSQSQDTTRCNDSSAFTPVKSSCSYNNLTSPSITPIPKSISRSPLISDFSLKTQTHTDKSPAKKALHIQYKSTNNSYGLLMALVVFIPIIICIFMLLS
ncbi:unnamed protein product [Blepharisma stoltei]|uniref:Uncharacterized protein n=1 Tax=Blepharisma stoltei TaxID=1481888 RepID=A0AAU9IPN5_9CILI|nr:unnamed protein product [Blepharisma stoltei]